MRDERLDELIVRQADDAVTAVSRQAKSNWERLVEKWKLSRAFLSHLISLQSLFTLSLDSHSQLEHEALFFTFPVFHSL